MKIILKKVLVVVLALVFGQSLMAEERSEVKKVEDRFAKKVDEVILIVQDKTLDVDIRNDKIVECLRPIFDFELMAKLSLGKKIWMSLDKAKRKEFVELYVKRMENSYSSKLNSYKNEVIDIEKVVQKKNKMQIFTKVRSKHEALEVVYKLYKTRKPKPQKDPWLIYDVEIIGISILKADKAQFKEYLQKNSIEDLMKVITKKKLDS